MSSLDLLFSSLDLFLISVNFCVFDDKGFAAECELYTGGFFATNYSDIRTLKVFYLIHIIGIF